VRILAAVLRKHLQQAATQRKAAGRDVDDTALQALVGKDLLLGGLNAFERNSNVRVQLFPLRCQAHTLRRAEEQRAAQLRFKAADDARDVRLIVVERGSGLRKALVLCGIVENTVAVIADVHGVLLLSRWGIYQFDI